MSHKGVTYRIDGTNQVVSFTTAAATTTNAVGTQTYRVRIAATQACFVKVGSSPTATTSDVFLPANWVETVAVTPGQKVSAIRSTADGTLTVTEILT